MTHPKEGGWSCHLIRKTRWNVSCSRTEIRGTPSRYLFPKAQHTPLISLLDELLRPPCPPLPPVGLRKRPEVGSQGERCEFGRREVTSLLRAPNGTISPCQRSGRRQSPPQSLCNRCAHSSVETGRGPQQWAELCNSKPLNRSDFSLRAVCMFIRSGLFFICIF